MVGLDSHAFFHFDDRQFRSSSQQLGQNTLVLGRQMLYQNKGHPTLYRKRAQKLLKRFKAALCRADVRAVRFHDLRHTFGTRMAAQGVPMRVLQELMGHRDFKTTLIYAD